VEYCKINQLRMENKRNKLFYVIIVLIGACIYFASEKTYYEMKVHQLQETVDRQAGAIESLERQKINY